MKKLLIVAPLLLQLASYAQNLELFQKGVYTEADGNTMPYRILFPENYDKKQHYPLLLFLHGAGERGNENERQLIHGSKLFLSEGGRHNFNGFVLAPQCPADNYWSSVSIDRTKTPLALDFDYSRPATTALTMAIHLLQKVLAEESVDPSRIYIAGLSMGGMGTFEAVYRYPNLFAAAVPICGGGDVARYDKRVKKVPFRVFHGDADAVVGVQHSREMVAKLKQLKVKVQYTEYPGVNHNSWDSAFAEPDFLTWLLKYKRKKSKF